MRSEYEIKTQKLCSQIPQGCCALISSDINRRYFTGMKSSAGSLLVFPDAAYLLIDFRYIEKARQTASGCTVIEAARLYDQIKELIKKHGAEKLWVESEYTTLAQYRTVRERLGDAAEPDPSDKLSSIITKMRQIKTEYEISMITKAQRIAEYAFRETLNFIKGGVTEKEIALCLNDHMLRNGAEELSFDTIALCGETTSMPHGVPSERTLKKGEFVLMDFGAVCEGYHSDMTRTVALGEPSEEMERVYNIVLEAQSKALGAARAGITGKSLDSAARDYIAEQGFGECFGHGLGHCVGMEIHESPCANTRDETVLEENMVITIEPGIYLPGRFGVRIEDFAVIERDSCFNLTNASKKLIKL